MNLMPGGVITHTPNSSTLSSLVNLNVIGDFNLQAGATIVVNGLGYAGGMPCSTHTSGYGPGGGGTGATGAGPGVLPLGGGGGGHAGMGGNGENANTGQPSNPINGGASYDNYIDPTDLGSGGGGGRSQGCVDGLGGYGGGTVLISIGGTLVLNGTITADGLPGHPAGGFDGDSGGGGGAGGTVKITAGSLSGTGSIHANVGPGAISGGVGGGGGGGGIVSIRVTDQNTSNLSVQANRGSGAGGSAAGGAGIAATRSGTKPNFDLVLGGLSAGLSVAPQAMTPIHGTNLSFGLMTLNNSAINFDSGSVVSLDNLVIVGTASLKAASISWNANAIVMPGAVFQMAATSSNGPLMVNSGGTFVQINTTPLTFTSVMVHPGGTMRHGINSTSRSSVLNLNVTDDFNLPAGATIIADGLGYTGSSGNQVGAGPGGGGKGYRSGGGGGHGGAGGAGSEGSSGETSYDSALFPTELGSQGGGSTAGGGIAGGAGGGAVLLRVGGTLTLDGLISANGVAGAPEPYYGTGGGGGGGGTININAAALAGTGVLRANGGGGTSVGGSGGGGGRIALNVTQSHAASLSIAALSGNGGGSTGINGGAGTIVEKNPGATHCSLTVGSSTRIPQAHTPVTDSPLTLAAVSLTNATLIFTGSSTSVDSLVVIGSATLKAPSLIAGSLVIQGTMTAAFGDLTLGNNPLEIRTGGILTWSEGSLSNVNLIVRNGGLFEQESSLPLNFTSIRMDPGAQITHRPNGLTQSSILNLNVSGNMIVQSGSAISVDGKGYTRYGGNQVGAGPGGGGKGYRSGGGGGHGGAGGAGSEGSSGEATYDSALFPTELGSQGGGSTAGGGIAGGAGGGAVLLQVGGTLTLDGLISANGVAGAPEPYYGTGGGGGGGGTININAAALAGTGVLRANGGGGTSVGGSGGGGGRIALSYGAKTASYALLVAGGTGTGNGNAGTILDNNQLVGFSNTNSPPTVTFSQLQETLSASQSLTETLSAQALDFSGATSTGVTPGTFSQAQMRLVTLQSGSLAGNGFFRGAWTLGLADGAFLSGLWQGAAFLTQAPRRMVLKGVLAGGIRGVLEGVLTESVPGSGNFDRMSLSCGATQIGNQFGASRLHFSGSAPAPQSTQYPGTALNLRQSSLTGQTSGYEVGPLENTFTLVTVNSPGNPYNGEGFFLPTYSSTFGTGVGWAYAVANYSQVARLSGLYDQPIRSRFEGILVAKAPRSLLLTLERLDVGAPIQPLLSVLTTHPHVAFPGAVESHLITIRNDGFAAATGVSVVVGLTDWADFVSASGSYVVYNVASWRNTKLYSPTPFVRWDIAQIPPRSAVKLNYQARFRLMAPGGPQPHEFLTGGHVELLSKAWADQVFAHYPVGGTP